MREATDQERQSIVDYLASQASDERVELLQKVYSERVGDVVHDVWDVHTDRERWWVITRPTNLYSQKQFPNMDLALTFHVGLCIRIPRADRQRPAELLVEPLLGCWRAFQQASDAIGTAQELEDYQAIGVRCREALLTLIHAVQDAIDRPAGAEDLKRSDFLGWADAIADAVLSGASQRARRGLAKSSAKAAWEFANWLTHTRSAHFHDAEAALSSTEQVLNLFTAACIRHLRGVPDSCPRCGSQRLAPERGFHTSAPERVYERPVCAACGWSGAPVEIPTPIAPSVRRQPEGDCAIMEVPLRGAAPPRPTRREE
jgi:hypothetical protein